MKSFFKRKSIVIDGENLTIQELSAGDHLKLSKDETHVAEIVCSTCVVEWKGESVEAIRENVPARVMSEIVSAVFELSGIALAKNSEPAPNDGSSTV